MKEVLKKNILELVQADFSVATVLYEHGIDYFSYENKTLQQACLERGVDLQMLLQNLEKKSSEIEELKLEELPLELIVEYLKHSHHLFIKKRLPFLRKLIYHLPQLPECFQLVQDIKFAYAHFEEDFINHIYKEEDVIFAYTLFLSKASRGEAKLTDIYHKTNEVSLDGISKLHKNDEADEMQLLKEVTSDFKTQTCSTHLNVVVAALKDFNHEVELHTHIENEFFFPKAVALEDFVLDHLATRSKLN